MEKVSVATRFPFMKTPNEPESTVLPRASLSGAANVFATGSAHKKTTANQRPCFDIFIPTRSNMPPPPQPHRHLCRWYQYGPKPSGKRACAAHKVRETVRHPATTDAAADPAHNGEKAPPPHRQEKSPAPVHSQAMRCFQGGRTLLRLMPPRAGRHPIPSRAHAAPRFPGDEIPPHLNREKSLRRSDPP